MASDTILGMERRQFFVTLFALFIIILFVGSSLVFLQDQYTNDTPDANTPVTPTTPTTLPYVSVNSVSATVSETYGTIILIANTNHTVIDDIDAEMFTLGARNVQSQYESRGNGAFDYRAEVELASGKSPAVFLADLRQKSKYVSNIQSGIRGIAKLSDTNILMENLDLNVRQTLVYPQPFLPVILAEATQKGDSVLLRVSAQLAGTYSAQVQGFETENATANPTSFSALQTVTLLRFTPLLAASGNVYLSHGTDQNALHDLFAGVPDVNHIDVALFETSATVSIIADGSFADFNAQLFDNQVSAQPFASLLSRHASQASPTQLRATFTLTNPADVNQVISGIRSKLVDWNLSTTALIQEEPIFFQARLSFPEPFASKSSFLALQNLLENDGVTQGEVQAQAFAHVDSLFVSDLNQTLDINQDIGILLKSPHLVGDEVSVMIEGGILRGTIVEIFGSEQ